MKDFVFITGNQNKADYLTKWLGLPVQHQKADVDELQSLDLEAVASHKARQAFAIVGRPVLVEDVAVTFHALGRLPGPLIKWFLEELKPEGLCKLLQPYTDRRATASIMYAYFDGKEMKTFRGDTEGTVPDAPRSNGDTAWKTHLSWNSIFVPDGAPKTYGEMSDEELKPFSHRAKGIAKLAAYLQS